MANDSNIISKLTKKLKINKKKKSTWKTLNSSDNLPPTPTDEYMLYSDTEAELYKAKVNVQANRSFSYNNSFNANEPSKPLNTNNILGNNNTASIGRSKTYNNRSTTTTFTYNNRPTYGASQPPQPSSKYLYPTESRKNSFQTVYVSSPPTTSVTSPAQPLSSPNSPISIDSSDTYVNDLKTTTTNTNNPFLMNTNPTSIHPKATPNQINTHLTVSTSNMDPALSHTLISPIEFDGAGNEIKKPTITSPPPTTSTTTTTVTATATAQKSKPVNTKEPVRTKSVKRIKPLITFDTPPVVSPIMAESDSDEYVRGRKRGGKKTKKYSKKRSSPLLNLKTSNLSREVTSPSSKRYNQFSPETSAVAARAHSRLNSPTSPTNEEDDDVPLGIIQYKCLSTLLKESTPSNISSLQSNTKISYKSKENYGYMSPPAESSYYSDKYDIPKYTNYSSYYHENYVI